MEEQVPRPKPVGWRVAFIAAWVLLWVVAFAVSCFVTPKFTLIFDQLGMKDLPAPTIAMLALTSLFADCWYFALVICLAGVGAAAIGVLDRYVAKAAILTGILTPVFFFVWNLSVRLPIIKIEEHLNHP